MSWGADSGVVYPAGPFDKDGAREARRSLQVRLAAKTAPTSSTTPSAAITPKRRCARSLGRGASSSSAFPPASPGFRSTSRCSRAARSSACSGATSRAAIPRPTRANNAELIALYRSRQDQAAHFRALSARARRRGDRLARRARRARQGRRHDAVKGDGAAVLPTIRAEVCSASACSSPPMRPLSAP